MVELTLTSLSGVPNAASQAGVVVAAGEEAKADQYLDIVNSHEGDFFPLVTFVFSLVLGHLLHYPSFIYICKLYYC